MKNSHKLSTLSLLALAGLTVGSPILAAPLPDGADPVNGAAPVVGVYKCDEVHQVTRFSDPKDESVPASVEEFSVAREAYLVLDWSNPEPRQFKVVHLMEDSLGMRVFWTETVQAGAALQTEDVYTTNSVERRRRWNRWVKRFVWRSVVVTRTVEGMRQTLEFSGESTHDSDGDGLTDGRTVSLENIWGRHGAYVIEATGQELPAVPTGFQGSFRVAESAGSTSKCDIALAGEEFQYADVTALYKIDDEITQRANDPAEPIFLASGHFPGTEPAACEVIRMKLQAEGYREIEDPNAPPKEEPIAQFQAE